MKRFEKIKQMSVEEMSKFFSKHTYPNLPHSACYICKYAYCMGCSNPGDCTDEYMAEVYKMWLNEEVE